MATKLKLGTNNNWATKEGKLLGYNDENNNFKSIPFDVTSDADATRINKDGLVERTKTNVPRVSFNGADNPYLLLEPSRQNYTAYSEQFNNSYWTKATSDSTANPTVTANAAIAPDGTQTADKVDLTAPPNNEWAVVKRDSINTGATVGSKLQQSLYLKAYDSSQVGKNVDIYMYDFSNTRYSTVYQYTLTADWQRVVVEHTIVGSNTSTNIQFAFGKGRSSVGGSTQAETATDFLVWGAQLEKASYPTSYIPTSGSAVTRTADSCEIASGIENLIGQTEGTLFIDFEYLYETTSSSSTDANRDIFTLGTASDISEGISIDNYRSQFRVFVQGSGMTTQSIGNNTIGAAQPNTRYKLAVKYKTGSSKAYLNGSLIGSGTGTVSFAADLDGIFFSYNSSSRPFKNQKKVYQLMVFNTALSDSELQTLTS